MAMQGKTMDALARKLHNACPINDVYSADYMYDTAKYWRGIVKAWSVGSTRPLSDEEIEIVVVKIQCMEEAKEEWDTWIRDGLSEVEEG